MKVCVFCGSRFGADPAFREVAATVGRRLAERGLGVVYGGGHVGLMGVVADAAIQAGGEVTGVIPRALAEREVAHDRLAHLHVVESMHDRKALMAQLSDGFVALPGGAGTLDEIFEQWTWVQLGFHAKPCAFLNVKGYWDPLQAMIARMTADGFLGAGQEKLVPFYKDVEAMLDALAPSSRPG